MRAVIMEKKDNHIIVMTKDGQFKKIKKPQDDIEIGMEINIADGVHQNIRRIAAILIVVILMSGLGVSTYAYYTPYGYVNVDINPNVEIIYNRFNRVLKINGMNDDGKNLVESMEHYKYTKVEDTVSKIINQTIEEDESEETQVLITYDKIENQTLDLVKDAIQDDGHVNVYTIKMSTNEYEEIKNKGKSPGKAILIKDIIENHSNYTPKDLEQKSIKALIELSNDNIEDEKEIRKEIKKRRKK